MAGDADDAARLAALGEGSVSLATGLANPELERFRRELIDAISAEQGFDPSELAGRLGAFVKLAGKETVDQARAACWWASWPGSSEGCSGRRPGSRPLALTRPIASRPGPGRRLEPEDVFVLADRCLEATYHLQRNLYMPLVLESLCHDLGRLIGPRVPA